MIGLTKLQAEVYEAARAYEEAYDAEPFLIDIQHIVGCTNRHLRQRVYACIERGFLCFDDDGRLIINEPPHERAMRIVCEQFSVTPDDIRGRVRSLNLSAARRALSVRLFDSKYEIAAIGAVICRHFTTVHEFLRSSRGLERKRRRQQRIGLLRTSQEAAQCMA